ncbi:hypothetical protein PM082_024705 [Marasmius tenuissimus]|nr:hypothetical protein PM082_024705 [Marasmius tenuissimus]
MRPDTTDALIARLLDKTLGFTTCEPRKPLHPSPIQLSAPPSFLNNAISPAKEPIAPPASETTHPTAPVTVFVNDLRTTAAGKGRGQVTSINVPCVFSTSLLATPSHILAKDVMRELQKTNAAIRGNKTVTVSQQHSQYARYEVTFATAFNPNGVEETVYSPEILEYPLRGHLFLDVDHHSEEPEGSDCQALPSTQGPDDSGSTTHHSVTRVRTRTHHHALQNPEIVKRWRFMSEFANDYKKRRPKSSVKERFPTQEEIARALRYLSSTTLKNAVSAYRLIEDYKGRGVQRVIDAIEKIEDPPGGSIVLMKFLRGFAE